MIMKIKRRGYLLVITIILASLGNVLNNSYAQEPQESLAWSIEDSKSAFYPGEPVMLTLDIKNTGEQKEEIFFGSDGIEAFSMEIHDLNDVIVGKGEKIRKFGLTRVGDVLIQPSETASKLVVLNRWCSTLLTPGRYKIICNVEYRLRSEDKKQPNTIVIKAGPVHKIQLVLDVWIIEMDSSEFKKIIEDMASIACETKPDTQNKMEWLTKRDLAREMLALTESDLAVPYQLQLLRNDPYTWFGPDAVNSLVKSGTLEAAVGLMQIVEDPNVHTGDVKPIFIDGIYRLRDTGKADIINATENFVAEHNRPVLVKPMD